MVRTIKNKYHLSKAVLANIRYSFPAKKLKIIAVTGTDGKTTTTNLIYHILKQAGIHVGILSTISAEIDGKTLDTGLHVTTPDSFQVQRILDQAVKKGITHFVLEVTSHGLDQNRVWGVPVEIGIITNITEEHLDYHKTYENYLKSKLKLLKISRIKIINHDDRSYEYIAKVFNDGFLTYGLDKKSQVNPHTIGSLVGLLPDNFNAYNMLAAISALQQLGVSQEEIKKGLQSFVFPKGRQNLVYEKEFKVMIDFAHTPNSFEQILSSMRPATSGRIIHVFGSAGQRDREKRPKMGAAASKYSDVIILTAEDPRKESVESINKMIVAGIDESFRQVSSLNGSVSEKVWIQIPDRKQAINTAIKIAQKGDLVLITGKGHEQSINYGKGEVVWDEFVVVREALKERGLE